MILFFVQYINPIAIGCH